MSPSKLPRPMGNLAPITLQTTPSHGESPPHLFLDPQESASQTASRSAIFAQLIRVPSTETDRQTDTQTTLRATSQAIVRIYALHQSARMRRGLMIN